MTAITPNFIAGGIGEWSLYYSGLVALAGGAKAGATQLDYGFSEVDTVVNANDSVLLPPAVPRAICVITNNDAANSMQVFGQGTDTINGVATATGVAQAHAITAMYVCYKAGAWFRILSA